MKYNRLGQSNLRVSALCLGTMMFGDQTDAMESMRIVDFAREERQFHRHGRCLFARTQRGVHRQCDSRRPRLVDCSPPRSATG